MISGIILASGFSERMGREKLILHVEGMPVVERVIRAAKFSQIDEVILVYQNEAVRKIGDKYGIKAVYNGKALEGQSAALKTGIMSSYPDTDGYMFLVGDQPFLDSDTINELLDIFKAGQHGIVVPVYKGHRGNPVLFSSQFRQELLSLEGDCGGRMIIDSSKEHVKLFNIRKSIVGADIDTAEDYKKISP